MTRIYAKDITEMMNSINETLADRGYNWHLVGYHAYGIMDVKKQVNGDSGNWNITPDVCTTNRELYNWLRGFASALWTRKE